MSRSTAERQWILIKSLSTLEDTIIGGNNMSDNNVIMYDKPIIKKMKDIEYGDIIEVEYGDFDNFVDVVVTDMEKTDDGSIKTTGMFLLNQEPFEGYSLRDSGDKVIGKYLGDIVPK